MFTDTINLIIQELNDNVISKNLKIIVSNTYTLGFSVGNEAECSISNTSVSFASVPYIEYVKKAVVHVSRGDNWVSIYLNSQHLIGYISNTWEYDYQITLNWDYVLPTNLKNSDRLNLYVKDDCGGWSYLSGYVSFYYK